MVTEIEGKELLIRSDCNSIRGDEAAKHILVKCSETKRCREGFVCSKWLNINKDLACEKVTNYKCNRVKNN
jgi:hypothetical protein